MKNRGWYTGDRLPRLWLTLAEGNLLIQWETVSKVMAANDFLTIGFDCEWGHITVTGTESLKELFENLQQERVNRIDGRILKVKIVSSEKNTT